MALLGGDEADELKRPHVGPVHVVEDHGERPAGADSPEEPADGLVEAKAGRGRIERRRRRRAIAGEEPGHRGGDRGERAGIFREGVGEGLAVGVVEHLVEHL